MPFIILTIYLMLSAFGALDAIGSAMHEGEAPDESSSELTHFRGQLEAASEVASDPDHSAKEWKDANRILVSGLADPRFARLSRGAQGRAMAGAGWAADRLHEYQRARDLFAEATRRDPEWSDAWYVLAQLEDRLEHKDAAAKAMAVYIRKWPQVAQEEDPDGIVLRIASSSEPGSAGGLELMQVLYDKNWSPEDPKASVVWHKLALERLRKGQRPAARAVIGRIIAPESLIELRSDKRFDGLYDPQAREFDPVTAAGIRLKFFQAKAELEPKQLKPTRQVLGAMLELGMDEAVLASTDPIMKAAAEPSRSLPFKDADELPSIMELRADALRHTGKPTEALALMERAASIEVNGKPNTNQALDLALAYCSLGRGKDAIAAAAKVVDMNDYGRMVQAAARHCGALLQGDRKAAAVAMGYLQEHREDGPNQYLNALLRENRLDEAAKAIGHWLETEARRADMLYVMQDFKQHESTSAPGDKSDENWKTVVARKDVQDAVAKVGRIQRYELY